MSTRNRIGANIMKHRNAVIAASMSCTAALAMAGCSSGSGAQSESGSATDLTWSMWVSSTDDQNAWKAIADLVPEQDPSTTVTLQGSPWNDYWTKLGTLITSDDSPCLVSIQSARVRTYQDALVPLNDLVNEDDLSGFDSVALDAMKVDGNLYALPYDTGPAILFYNSDMFEEAGIPDPGATMTADEFESAAEKLKAAGDLAFGATVEDTFLESQVLAYNGGQAVAEDGTFDVTNDAFLSGVSWIADLVKNGEALTADGADGTADDNAFISGRIASHVNGPWSVLDLSSKTDFAMGVTSLPAGAGGGTTYSSGSGFGISKKCDSPEKAMRAIEIMTGESALEQLASEGRAFPARTDAQEAWYEKASDVLNVKETLEAAQKDSIPLPSSTLQNQFNQLLGQYGVAAVNGTSDPESTFTEIASQLK
jgi:multiple sugar transport system substrate-binding protein/raffinose/stachyose/melibiose transport system substrate-binding protein